MLAAHTLMEVWEQGLDQPLAVRGLLLLALTWPEHSLEQLAELGLGERNRRLLHLRQHLFGPLLGSVVNCPGCRERLELSFPLQGILAAEPAQPASATFKAKGYRLTFRLPNSMDLLRMPRGDKAAAREGLLERCVLEASYKGKKVEELPQSVLEGLCQQMGQADPHLTLEFALDCPQCQHSWVALLDMVGFLWAELDHWARNMLVSIHQLASAYGWREDEILALSPWRRQAYLELIGA